MERAPPAWRVRLVMLPPVPAGLSAATLIEPLPVVKMNFKSIAPAVGTTVTKDESYAEVESVKAVSDVIAPLSGEIIEVNESLADNPEQINDEPYDAGWMVKVRLSDPSEVSSLLDRGAYADSLT